MKCRAKSTTHEKDGDNMKTILALLFTASLCYGQTPFRCAECAKENLVTPLAVGTRRISISRNPALRGNREEHFYCRRGHFIVEKTDRTGKKTTTITRSR